MRGLICAVVCCALVLAVGSVSSADGCGISVYTDKTSYVKGEDTLVMSVSGFNNGQPVNVDVHVAVLPPGGGILEIPDWNTDFRPFLSNVRLQDGFLFPQADIGWYSVGDYPFNLTGDYFFAAAFTEVGTLNFVSEVSFAPFDVRDGGSGDGWSTASVSISWERNFDEGGNVAVRALATFLEYEHEPQGHCDTSEIEMDTCTLVTYSMDLGDPGPIPSYLDAGEYLDMYGSPPADVRMNRHLDEGWLYYYPDYELGESHYSPGTEYTFEGYGGPDVGAFEESVTAPPTINLYQPALGQNPTINRSSDYNVTWEAKGYEDVYVTLYTSDMDIMSGVSWYYRCYCRFEDDGSGTIPASILGQLPPSGMFSHATIAVRREDCATLQTSGLDPGGAVIAASEVNGTVTLQ